MQRPPNMTPTAPPASTDAAAWKGWALARLSTEEAATDPLANPVRSLAHELARREGSEPADHAALLRLAKSLCDDALLARADAFGAAHAQGAAEPAALVARALRPLESLGFDEVKRALERARAGLVFTAHPTFAMSGKLRAAFAARACAGDEALRRAAEAGLVGTPHWPDEPLTLAVEHGQAAAAIGRAQDALRALTREILRWLRERFPERWREVAPAPLSLATWVGYDLDGRTDIHWADTFRIRLEEKAAQLSGYAKRLAAAAPAAAALAARLSDAAALAREQAALFAGDLSDPARVVAAANRLTGEDPRRLTSLQSVIAELDALIAGADDEAALGLAVLRAEMRNCGLGIARIHLRVNAAQLSSALRADLKIDSDAEIADRSALDAAARKAADAAGRPVNFAAIFNERMTARRQFMLCAQILKHIDNDTPIRFLIAECEAPATVMGAIYLARLYGVDRRLDISPLFETPEAIERGGRFMERLLAEPEYLSYIRARGRIAVQAGFSDSGRFMGQIPAGLGIERLHILVSRALAAAKATDVEAVVFNTHGESMGRGGFPGALAERFDWAMTPWARARFAHDGVRLCAEASFQGGDGYLHFETDALAAAAIGAFFAWSVDAPAADREDRYYRDINYSWDVYRAVKGWQEALLANPDYQASVSAFGPQLLATSGSRRARRQGDQAAGLRSIRAIPHNAILQQLALPVNVFGGLGSASSGEAERFLALMRGSPRMSTALRLAAAARARTSIAALRSYASLYDPGFWIAMAAAAGPAGFAERCEALAFHLKDHPAARALARLADHAAADLARFDRVLAELQTGDAAAERARAEALHAVRQALIQRAFLIVAGLPPFSGRHDMTRASLFGLAFELRLDEVAELLAVIFPAAPADPAQFADLAEPGDACDAGMRGYPEIHADAIRPLRGIHRSIREIGVGLSHFYGAYG